MTPDSKPHFSAERAEATETLKSTPISGKDHEYRADGDHRPRPLAPAPQDEPDSASARTQERDAAAQAGVETERHISEGIPGAGRSSGSA